MGILKTILMRTNGAGSEKALPADPYDETKDLEPVVSPYASAQAAIDKAIAMRAAAQQVHDRRDPLVADRRIAQAGTSNAPAIERRGSVVNRRNRPQGFGRRNREPLEG